MAITAQMVKELREKTGAGMMDCKKALEAANGDFDAAVEAIKEKGAIKAEHKSTRVAVEGLTAIYTNGNVGAVVEVNSETDFVAKNQDFIDLVALAAKIAVENKTTTAEETLNVVSNGKTLNEVIGDLTAKIGEKISLRRVALFEKTDAQSFGSYSHMGGKIASLAVFDGADAELAKDVAMHIAASEPKYVSREDISADFIETFSKEEMERALEENATAEKPKPANIIEKIVEGRINKNLKEMCLLEQPFVKNPDVTVAAHLGSAKCLGFARFQVGEGMEKKADNFAEEVMSQIRG